MQSVTQVVKAFKQPRGGFIKPKEFEEVKFDDGKTILDGGCVHQQIIGMSVDYLTRYELGQDRDEAFRIQLMGADIAAKHNLECALKQRDILNFVNGLDDDQITAACMLQTFDVWYRNIGQAMYCKSADEIFISDIDIENIRTLVQRQIHMLNENGPIKSYGFDFQPNGYSRKITTGDGDFLTADTMIDLKVQKNKPTNKHTLQLAVYWLMGKMSGNYIFNGIHYIAIANPWINSYYRLDMNNLDSSVVTSIAKDVIGYEVDGNNIINRK